MKRAILVKVCEYISDRKKIYRIERVDDTVLKIEFNKEDAIYFDMKKGNSYIFKTKSYNKPKNYAAPFDIVLKKRIQNAYINKIEVLPKDRVLKFTLNQSKGYKSTLYYLFFEFTGKNTNIIITDENEIIIEALRHIDQDSSFREIKSGVKLKPLPKFELREKSIEIENIEQFLYKEFELRVEQRLSILKDQKIKLIEKKIKKLNSLLENFESSKKLKSEAKKYSLWANLLLNNLHKLEYYQKKIVLSDYEGNDICIDIPQEARNIKEAVNIFFNLAKKLNKKAKNIHIEIESLSSKILFLNRLKEMIIKAKSIDEINILMPKQKKRENTGLKSKEYEVFFFEDYKIMVGKNSKGNETLLKEAKKNDIWLHLKDIPSTHVIIRTDKKEVPLEVLKFSAKLCINFTDLKKGRYIVDYTKRRDVKIKEGSFVNYFNHKSLVVEVEG